ncbi:MAG: extracellular solute-binding protein [Anaerolineaceae bacterium]
MSKKFSLIVCLILVGILALTACQPKATPIATEAPVVVEPVVYPLVEIEAAAKTEGTLVSYGLPDSWVNYAEMKQIYTSKYGIAVQDTDMGSGEIIAALEAEAKAPVADITDLGLNFAKIVEDNKLSQPYKHAYWDEIPDYAKDPEGRWSAAYWGAIAFLVNADAVTTVPQTWTDLLKDEYVGKVCMKDPRSSATANMVVLGAAYGLGGDEKNVQPGLDFFKQMIDKGILNGVKPSTAAIQKGECPISLFWDFDALANKQENATMNLQVIIPSEGTVGGMYVQFITAGAPHANAAKLMIELEFSDEGQLAYANGFVHPMRTSVALPADLLAKFPAASAYEVVKFPKDYVALDTAGTAISDGWELIAK